MNIVFEKHREEFDRSVIDSVEKEIGESMTDIPHRYCDGNSSSSSEHTTLDRRARYPETFSEEQLFHEMI